MKIVFILSIFLSTSLFSQTTFQTHFHSCRDGVGTYASETDEGYFILGTTGFGCISFTMLDSIGNIIRTKDLELDDAYIRAFDQALVQDDSGNFVILCEYGDEQADFRDPFLVKIDGATFDTLWTKRYETPNRQERCRSIQKYRDGFLLLATTMYPTWIDSNSVHIDSSKLMFIQTDERGEVLNQVDVEDDFLYSWTGNFGVVKDDQIAVVFESSTNSANPIRAQGQVGLLDTGFNFIWIEELQEKRNHDLPTLITSSEGDEIYTSYQSYEFFQDIGQSGSGNVFAYDLLGNPLWETALHGGGVFKIEYGDIASNKDIINCGYTQNNQIYDKDYGRIFRMTSEGRKVWDRLYSFPNSPLGYTHFFNVIETRDGGVLATGYLRNSDFNDYEMHVLKLDANGCLKLSCDSIALTLPLPQPTSAVKNIVENFITVYPNPAREKVNFTAPLNRHFFKNEQLVIHDLSGKKIKEFIIENPTNEIYWDVSGEQFGVYLYQLFSSEKEIIASGKVIVR